MCCFVFFVRISCFSKDFFFCHHLLIICYNLSIIFIVFFTHFQVFLLSFRHSWRAEAASASSHRLLKITAFFMWIHVCKSVCVWVCLPILFCDAHFQNCFVSVLRECDWKHNLEWVWGLFWLFCQVFSAQLLCLLSLFQGRVEVMS